MKAGSLCARRSLRLAAVGAALLGSLAAAAPTAAATITVPDDHPTIQDAVDAASPGDVIQVRNGRYEENVIVTTDSLTIRGIGERVIVERPPAAADNRVFAIEAADNFTLQRIRTRHGDIDCFFAQRCRFAALEVRGSVPGTCIEIVGANAVVRNSQLEACGSNAVRIVGDNSVITGTRARRINDRCFTVLGDGAVFRSNQALNCEDGEGLQLDGDDATIVDNVSRSIQNDGFLLRGDGLVVEGNRAALTERDCFDVRGNDVRISDNAGHCGSVFQVGGENPVLVGNRALPIDEDGFNVDCIADEEAPSADPCVAGTVSDNVAVGSGDDDEGFDIFVDEGFAGFTVSGNRASDNNSEGFRFDMDGALVEDNVAQRNGSEEESGFLLHGSDNLMRRNSAHRNGGEGIQIDDFGIPEDAIGNVLRRNRVGDNNQDGIEIQGIANRLVANLALANLVDGIANEGQQTVVRSNGAAGNRVDCANDGTIAINQDNRCQDGSDFMEPGSGF